MFIRTSNNAGLIAVLLTLSLANSSDASTEGFGGGGNEINWHLDIADLGIPAQAMRAHPIDDQPLALTISNKCCVDAMTSVPYQKAASVEMDQQEDSGRGDKAASLQGEWSIEEIDGRAVLSDSQPTINFGEGQISGNGSCNRYFGPYLLSGQGMKIWDLGSSMMLCEQPLMEQEAMLMRVLGETRRFEIGPDGRLVLHSANGKSVVARRK